MSNLWKAAMAAGSSVADVPYVGPILAAIAFAATFAAGLALMAFKEGGYTGAGGKDEPAGIVHKGEFVIPAHIVNQPGALPALEAIRQGRQAPGASFFIPTASASTSTENTLPAGGLVALSERGAGAQQFNRVTAPPVTGSKAFAEGGYTGSGAKDEPAGTVHRGEFVIPANIVKQPGALPALEMIRQGGIEKAISNLSMVQYMDGGYVGGSTRFDFSTSTMDAAKLSTPAPSISGTQPAIQPQQGTPAAGRDTHVNMFLDESAVMKHVRENPDFEHHIVGIMSRNKHAVVSPR
jgi:phage-related minor tail protein